MKYGKPLYIFLILSVCSLFSYSTLTAQNASLTKGETVNYINQKLSEMNDVVVLGDQPNNKKFLRYCTASLQGNKLTICYSLYFEIDKSLFCSEEYVFNPMYLIDPMFKDEDEKSNGVISLFTNYDNPAILRKVTYASYTNGIFANGIKSMKYGEDKTETTTLLQLYIPFDASFKKKLRKAFYHLRDLLKAEDDVF